MRRRGVLAGIAALLAIAHAPAPRAGAEEGPPPCDPDVACPGSVLAFPGLGIEIAVEVAATPATRALGLGGHAPLGEFDGMLFAFDGPGRYPFWMKGMTFALDMLWLAPSEAGDGSLVVVHVAADVPADPPGTPDAARPTYGPPVPATHVLEVNAGLAAAHGIAPGAVAFVRAAEAVPVDPT